MTAEELEEYKSAVSDTLTSPLEMWNPSARRVKEKPTAGGFQFSPDFHSCRWGNRTFTFPGDMQAAVMRVMWVAYQNGTLAMKQRAILQEAGSSMAESDATPRLSKLFIKHPAWGTLIVPAGKGCYRIADPPL